MIKLILKRLNLGDVEDPEVYLGAAVWDWFQTPHGAWCKEHVKDMTYHSYMDYNTMGHKYYITGIFSDEDALIYKLKWGDSV